MSQGHSTLHIKPEAREAGGWVSAVRIPEGDTPFGYDCLYQWEKREECSFEETMESHQ